MTLEGDPCVDCIMTECEVMNTEMKAVFEHWAVITEIDNSADKGAYSFLAAYVCEDACVLDCTVRLHQVQSTVLFFRNRIDSLLSYGFVRVVISIV